MTTRIETTRYPNITYNPAVGGGAAVVAGTVLPVRTLAFHWRQTHDRKRILRSFPQLKAELPCCGSRRLADLPMFYG